MLTLKVYFLILDFASEISRANKSSQLELQVWLKVRVQIVLGNYPRFALEQQGST